MPKDNSLEPVKLPMTIRFNERPTTRFLNNLESIDVQLIESPTLNDLRNYLVPFLEATWSDNMFDSRFMTIQEKDAKIIECLKGRALPTALETVNLVFSISGISLQEVTHILRYRNASFAADCSGDKWWTHKDALVPNSIQKSDEFNERYESLVEQSKQLYCDMINSRKISIMDARYILPRCLSTFYFMRMSLKDCIHFIIQRIDKQIQPETDNIIAYQMYLNLLERFAVMNGMIDIHQPSKFYMSMARSGRATNLYFPDEDSDKFDWNEDDFIYQCRRDEMNGTNPEATNLFTKIMREYEGFIAAQEAYNEISLLAEHEDSLD